MSTPRSAAAETLPQPRPLSVRKLLVERLDAGKTLRRILDCVGFDIQPGAVVAVTGPSGAGKTSLLHAVAGLVKPDAGTVLWGDLDVTALPETARDRWRRETVGLVFQDFQLLDELGVLENILLPARFDHWRTPRALTERAAALADRVGLDPRRQRAGALSPGEQQRVALARALLRNPQLILADEPTANLDAENSQRVLDLLIESAGEAQAGILLVSHDPAALARAGRVLRLEAGALRIARGTP